MSMEDAIKESGFLEQHWLLYKDEAGWGCDKCDWTGPTIDDFWKVHGRDESVVPF